jgi:hypothetical protein
MKALAFHPLRMGRQAYLVLVVLLVVFPCLWVLLLVEQKQLLKM